MKKAIVIGSTGMVGSQLIQLLIENEEYSEIVSLVRRVSGVTSLKLKEHVVNFDEPETWSKFVKGNVLFSALGTTIAQAKTKENQYNIDFTIQYTVAKIAANNGVNQYVLISSAGSYIDSKTFYLKMKGELEFAVQSLPFETISILRPGLLTGIRPHIRPGEKTGYLILKGLNKLGLFRRYKPIEASKVAKAMIEAAKGNKSSKYTLNEVSELADSING